MNSLLAAALIRVVCFGDSTTAPRQGVIPYCDQIRGAGIETINRGVGGNTTEAARLRFASAVLAARPDVVIIQFGINDSTVDVWKTPPETAPRVSLSRYRENLAYFLGELHKSGVKVILMTFNPLTWIDKTRGMYGHPPYLPADPDGFNQGREPYLAAIREVALAAGATLVDVDSNFRQYAAQPGKSLDDLLLDGMHPNTRGHERISQLLRSAFSVGDLHRNQLLHGAEIARALHDQADAVALRVSFGCIQRLQALHRKSTLACRLHRFAAQDQRHEEAATGARRKPHDRPFAALQPQRPA